MFAYVSVPKVVALEVEKILPNDKFKLRRMIKEDIQAGKRFNCISTHYLYNFLGCHVSILLPEERKLMSWRMLRKQELKWANRGIKIQVVGVKMFKKGSTSLFALEIKSQDLIDFRLELGLIGLPKKMEFHCTLFDSYV